MAPRVLVAGGSYAGLSTIVSLLTQCRNVPCSQMGDILVDRPEPKQVDVEVTLVDERDGYLHLIGIPLAFTCRGYADKSWVRYDQMPALDGVRIIQGSIESIDPATRTATIRETRKTQDAETNSGTPVTSNILRSISYDYFVAATGLRREWPSAPSTFSKSDFVEESNSCIERLASTAPVQDQVSTILSRSKSSTEKARKVLDNEKMGETEPNRKIQKDETEEESEQKTQVSVVGAGDGHGVLVVGGGAVGIEMAAELKVSQPEVPVTLVHSRNLLMSSEDLPDTVKEKSAELLGEEGVEVLLGRRLVSQQTIQRKRSVSRHDTPVDEHASYHDGSDEDEEIDNIIEATFSDGSKLEVGEILMAASKPKPTSSYLPKNVLDKDGYLLAQHTLQFPKDTPNCEVHFGVGDINYWTGIKRCGGAMHMGFHAGYNLFRLILAARENGREQGSSSSSSELPQLQQLHIKDKDGTDPEAKPKNARSWPVGLKTLEYWGPSIGVAIANQAVTYSESEGMTYGREAKNLYFQDDLCFEGCFNHLKLGQKIGC